MQIFKKQCLPREDISLAVPITIIFENGDANLLKYD
jgi:hypothetical protein